MGKFLTSIMIDTQHQIEVVISLYPTIPVPFSKSLSRIVDLLREWLHIEDEQIRYVWLRKSHFLPCRCRECRSKMAIIEVVYDANGKPTNPGPMMAWCPKCNNIRDLHYDPGWV